MVSPDEVLAKRPATALAPMSSARRGLLKIPTIVCSFEIARKFNGLV
jgi:hypothetical protein